jgi:hypothetical protein
LYDTPELNGSGFEGWIDISLLDTEKPNAKNLLAAKNSQLRPAATLISRSAHWHLIRNRMRNLRVYPVTD